MDLPVVGSHGDLDVMQELAVDLSADGWCELCNAHLATVRSADGVGACEDCARARLVAMGVVPANRKARRDEARRNKAINRRRARKK